MGKSFVVGKRENSQRYLEESRAERKERLVMAGTREAGSRKTMWVIGG